MKPFIPWRPSLLGTVALSSALLVACSTAATPTPTTTSPTPTIAAAPAVNPTSAPPSGATDAVAPTASPTPAPAVTPLPSGIVSARDDVTLVVGGEPAHVNPFLSGAGIPDASFRDNVVDPLAWQSGDDQRIVPTTATTAWQQIAPNQWRFTLRQGVKFQDGEPWNAQAAVPSLQFQGEPGNGTTSNPYTGNYTARAVDDYNVDIICEQACPIFPNTSFFVNFISPNFLATNPPDEPTQTTVSFGPYKIVEWEPGVAITEEAYDGYTPARDHYEFQKPYIKKTKWLWRNEPTVAGAMIQTSEADIAWDIGIDVAQSLSQEMVRSGGSTEVYAVDINTLWNPELKKVKVRQAMAHAINCQEMIDSLYAGKTVCRGNIIFPGVVGATEENTAPYTYDPELSRQLLQEAGYDPNTTFTFAGRSDRFPNRARYGRASRAT